ncbi:DNA mismatch repair muts family protein [Arabidopsis lyrata subsp. lyrata]|uniref:DNA mismatch repair muts family protein n=1 Tax=Arabidopsis lyrata subsp. lyrata TaxID=81972 RepID=D7MTP1_ARALL|nr:DNA mismatch repair muts family protein [Arabidopsis lyrata subsp. lyrata]
MQTLAFCNNCALVIRNSIGNRNRNRVNLSLISSSSPTLVCRSKSKSQTDSLRVLEWDKLCDVVASFARTSLGREATKKKLWSLDQSFSESLKLLDETDAAIKMLEHGSFCLDLSSIHISLVESGIRHAKRRLSLRADQALEIASLLRFFDTLQFDLKAAIKQDGDWYKRFMPLSELIMHPVINRSFVKLVEQVIDPDGTIKDSASSALRQSRERVQTLERKLQQLLDAIIRSQKDDESVLVAAEIDGRWCIQMSSNQLTSVNGLLLSSYASLSMIYFHILSLEGNMCFSGSGGGTVAEPIAAVSMNDDLQSARASVAKAEAEILSMLTEKINARATYSRAYGGAHPDIYLPPEDGVESLSAGENSLQSNLSSEKSLPRKEWLLYLPRCYHPLLLYQHKKGIRKTRETIKFHKTADTVLSGTPPIPADFQISKGTRVLVITGPNTGGKTICLKSVGLAAMMAKSGLYVLATESARIPWFDNIYADIGDEQSLLQSLSTFSGHLKQISEILSHSTSRSLVLLDEVGAGTNPLEGAALGMAILESFAESGSLLTMATTHHGELKTLKYSNSAFENACMEFDDLNLKPTFKILWGVPGRSNAINIAERLGLPCDIIESARELYGSASAEINEVILDMERYKQEYQRLLNESRVYIRLSRELHDNLLIAQKNINDHATKERRKMRQELTQAGSMTRSTLRRTLQQFRSSAAQSSQSKVATQLQTKVETTKDEDSGIRSSSVVERRPISEAAAQKVPEVGSSVFVSSLGKKATVLKVEQSKKEILVQVGIMKMKVKLTDVVA